MAMQSAHLAARAALRRWLPWRTAPIVAFGIALAAVALPVRALDPGNGPRIAVGAGPGGPGTACITCHGVDGMGDAASGSARLAGLDAHYLVKQLDDYISGTRPSPIMQPIARQLGAGDRAAVAHYYAQLTPAVRVIRKMQAVDPAQLQRGAVLWAQGSAERQVQGCVNCHGGAARAGHGQIFPDLAGQPATYITDQFLLWTKGERRNDTAGVMAIIAKRLPDEDVRAVATYLSQLPP
jgi:cytochrome c553